MEALGPQGWLLDTLALDAPDPSLLFDMPVVRAGKAVLRHAADPKISNEAKNVLRLLLFPLVIARPVRAQSHQYRSESHAI